MVRSDFVIASLCKLNMHIPLKPNIRASHPNISEYDSGPHPLKSMYLSWCHISHCVVERLELNFLHPVPQCPLCVQPSCQGLQQHFLLPRPASTSSFKGGQGPHSPSSHSQPNQVKSLSVLPLPLPPPAAALWRTDPTTHLGSTVEPTLLVGAGEPASKV